LTDDDSAQREEVDLVCVLKCQGIDLAHIYKSKLETVGIPVLLSYDVTGPLFGLTIDGFGEVKVMVPAEFAADAEEVLGMADGEPCGEDADELPDQGEEETLPEE